MSDKLWQGEREFSARDLRRLERAGRVLAWVMRVWSRSWRVEANREKLAEIRRNSPTGGVLLPLLHNRMIVLPCLHMHMNIQVLRSSSKDGRLIAEVLKHLGFGVPVGSSSRGGAAGLRQILRLARQGLDIGITVDGPRGPRGRVKPGIIQTASMSGNPIVPFSAAPAWRHVFKSWDRTVLPLPFSRVRLYYGDPIYVPPRLDGEELEKQRLHLEHELRMLTDNLDEEMGCASIPPAPEQAGTPDEDVGDLRNEAPQ